MNRIVRENYPIERLPEDLRHELAGTHARVVIEQKLSEEELRADLDRKIQEGLDDIAAGRVYSAEEVRAFLKARRVRAADAAE